ncbi:hypothetical protein [Paraburkholderia sp. GAS334]|uniref:hypothetical protein n=1 Tax=Paraburkholderia sp. GAS334 TaxID=3035131 RepID=UPI003D2226F8
MKVIGDVANIAAALLLLVAVSGCAIEGDGFDGRVKAYNAAALDSREYVALHMGQRDPAWYQGWCGVVAPHFISMDDVHARVLRYCTAMQAQPENAESIWNNLRQELTAASGDAVARRNSIAGAFAAQQRECLNFCVQGR